MVFFLCFGFDFRERDREVEIERKIEERGIYECVCGENCI